MAELTSRVRFLQQHSGYRPVQTEARLLAWRYLSLRQRPAVVNFDALGFRLELPAEWRGMSKIAYVFREDAEPELRWLHHVVPRGGTAIDLGAHYGDYTLALSTLVGTNGRVVAVEPMRHALEVLHRNISINDAENVHVEPVGVGRIKARAVLHHHSDPSRASLGQMDENGRTEEIEITTLDEIVYRLGLERVDYVKLDIEGSEFDALEGGRTMLEQFRPVVQFEQQPRAAERLGHAPENVWDMLADLGYAFAALDDRGVLRQVGDPERWGPNFFAIPDRLPIEVLISAG